ncbi:MAG: hypothetical protein HFI16_03290 [Lachnospiraceae bacterium]|nr:hypothetical protein [Lachnospiraceae bacterium]
MIHALLDALRRQQLEQYEEQKIYELDYRNPTVKDSDVLLINLAAEYLGLQKTIELALACHARVVSLILWDPENLNSIPNDGHWPGACRTISLERAVVEFQARNMDLIYMRDPQDENGDRLIRLDFQNVCA